MRSTTVVSLLFAGWALLSQSPAAYAVPVPAQVNSAVERRQCNTFSCRIAEPTTTDTTSQTDVQALVSVLISALKSYQAQNSSSNSSTVVDLAAPEDTGAEPVPILDAIELADDAL